MLPWTLKWNTKLLNLSNNSPSWIPVVRNPQRRRLTQQKKSGRGPKLKNKVNNNSKEVIHSSQGIKTQGRRVSKEIKTTANQIMDWITSLNTTREMAKTMATNLCIRDNTNLFQIKLLCSSLELILA